MSGLCPVPPSPPLPLAFFLYYLHGVQSIASESSSFQVRSLSHTKENFKSMFFLYFQIAGPPGCGKTQFCMMFSVLATLPRPLGTANGSVAYIDTESAFSAQRSVFIVSSRMDFCIWLKRLQQLLLMYSVLFGIRFPTDQDPTLVTSKQLLPNRLQVRSYFLKITRLKSLRFVSFCS